MNFIRIPGKDFEMQDAPVTQSEWQEVMGENPSYFKDKPDNPVERVSWDDCQDFIKKLNESQKEYIYRLTTEDEWEFCAKPCYAQDIDKIAWSWENSKHSTQPVKTKEANSFGLYDMLGNVWAWTDTPIRSYRVIRGGSWRYAAQYLRSDFRGSYSPGYRDYAVGFRLLRTPKNNTRRSKTFTLDPKRIAPAVAKVQNALDELKEILK